MRLEGKRTIVTGAASGFGRGIAQTYIREGAKVAVVDMNGEGARAVAEELGPNAIALTCDVSKGNQVEAAVRQALVAFGRLDIVVNNAGWTNPNSPLMEAAEDTFRKIHDINVLSNLHMTKTCVPIWRDQGGGVMLNVGSTAGIGPRPGLTWYNSYKGAVNLMTKSLAVELAPGGHPGLRNCAGHGCDRAPGAVHGRSRHARKSAKNHRDDPVGSLSEPQDIANSALYLASDEAQFITGVILEVDGGRTI